MSAEKTLHELEKQFFHWVFLDYLLPKDMKLHVQTSEISIQNFQILYHIPRKKDHNESERSNFINDI